MMKSVILYIIAALLLCLTTASSQKYYLVQSVTGAGGVYGTSGSYSLDGSVGQPIVTKSSGGGGGFWLQYEGFEGYFATTFSLTDGWNLVSVPNTVPDYQKSVLYPGAVSDAFDYSGTYIPTSVLVNGRGYWLKFNGAQLDTIPGVPLAMDTIPVAKGWNMIGSVGSAVAAAAIAEVPPGIVVSSYFGYDGAYAVASSIEPGQGYWVKVSDNGNLLLNPLFGILPRSAAGGSAPRGMNSLTIETSGGKGRTYRQQLFFGAGSPKEDDLANYEMPPRAPEEKLDVRFATNRYAERFSGETNELPLSIHSNGMPVKLSVRINEHGGPSYSLVVRTSGKVVSENLLGDGKSVVLTPEDGKTLSLRVQQLPLSYKLEQNDPNPFNPTTTIRYVLPDDGHFTLKIYDMLGREVTTLIDDDQKAGYHSAVWNASNAASGVYFYRATARGEAGGQVFSEVKKMMLMK
jgi:hypothetical protein